MTVKCFSFFVHFCLCFRRSSPLSPPHPWFWKHFYSKKLNQFHLIYHINQSNNLLACKPLHDSQLIWCNQVYKFHFQRSSVHSDLYWLIFFTDTQAFSSLSLHFRICWGKNYITLKNINKIKLICSFVKKKKKKVFKKKSSQSTAT